MLLLAVEDEFLARYSPPTATYADMQRVYPFLKNDTFADYGPWKAATIQAWLNENRVDLETVSELQVGKDWMQVAPRDFKGNGGHEWLLTVGKVKAVNNPFANYLIAEQTSAGYHLVETALPWRGDAGYTYTDWRNGVTQSLFFGDLDGDGVPEWVVALGGVGGDFLNWGQLYVMKWIDGQMVDVSAPADAAFDDRMSYASPGGGGAPVFPTGVTIEFVKSLTQNALDIVIRHQSGDNWGCTWTEVHTYRWSGNTYRLSAKQTLYDDVQGCQWRDAEAAMWAGDLKSAITHYERGLSVNSWPYTSSISVASAGELVQYARIRLVIAYSLDGQTDKAIALITALKAQKAESDLMGQLISAITSVPGNDPFAIRTEAYNVFQVYRSINLPQDFSYAELPTNSLIGNTWDNNGQPLIQFGPPDPARAGCDPKLGLQYLIDHNTFSTRISPVDQLEVLGIQTTASLKLDMNDDGQDEWVVSPALKTPPLFFAPQIDHTYRVSFVPLESASPDVQMAVRSLPDHAGLVLLTTSARHTDLTCPPIYQGDLFWPKPEVFLDVWRLQDGVLVSMAAIPFCDPLALENIWNSDNHEVVGWAAVTQKQPGNPTDLAQAVYTWNAVRQKYLPPDQVDQLPLPPDPSPISWWDFRNKLKDALGNKQYDDALMLVDATLSRPFNAFADSDTTSLLHYWRGVLLELKGDDYGAVREYASLFEAVPQSAWGKLAMLHLEMAI